MNFVKIFQKDWGTVLKTTLKKKLWNQNLKKYGDTQEFETILYMAWLMFFFLIAWRTKKYFKNCILYIMKNIIGFIGV